jgi:hypothetical protein
MFGPRGICIPLKYSVLTSEAIFFLIDVYSEWTPSLQGHERGME